MSNTIDLTTISRSPLSTSNQSSNTDDFLFYKNVYVHGAVAVDSLLDTDFSNFGGAALSALGGIETGKSFRALGSALIEQTLTVNKSITALKDTTKLLSLQVTNNILGDSLNINNAITSNTLQSNNGSITHLSASDLTVTGNTGAILSTLSCSGLSNLSGGMSTINATVSGPLNVSGISTFSGGVLKLNQTSPVLSAATVNLGTDGSLQLQQNTNYNINAVTNGTFSVQNSSNQISFAASPSMVSSSVPFVVSNTDPLRALTVTGGLYSGGTVTANQNLLVNSTTASSSTSTGAVIVAGGVAVQDKVNVAGDIITLAGTLRGKALSTSGSATVDTLIVNSLTNTTNASTGAIVTPGGASIGADLRVANNVYILSTNDVMNGVPCSLQTQGGVNIAKKLNVGDLITANNGLSVIGNGNITGSLAASLPIYANSSLNATSAVSAAFVSAGGIACSKDIISGGSGSFATNLTAQMALSVGTTMQCAGDAQLNGNVNVSKNLICGASGSYMGDLSVGGSLTIGGSATRVNWSFFETNDNIICVNSGMNQVADGGYASSRYQTANNSAAGSVILDTPFFVGNCGNTNNTTTTINLGTTASNVDNAYNGMWILDSNNQVRKIKAYTASNQTATIYSSSDQNSNDSMPSNSPNKWTYIQGMDFNTVPTSATTFKLFNRQYMINSYVEQAGVTIFGSSPINPTTSTSANIQSTESLKFKSAYLDGSLYSDSILPFTTNGPINVNGVGVQNGKLTNVSSINNVKSFAPVVIQVIDNAQTGVTLSTATFGIYTIHVTPQNSTGSAVSGYVMMYNNKPFMDLKQSPSSTGEQVSIKWTPGNAVQIYHSVLKTNGTGASINYNVLIENKTPSN